MALFRLYIDVQAQERQRQNWNGASSYIGCRYLEKYPYIFVRVAYNYLKY